MLREFYRLVEKRALRGAVKSDLKEFLRLCDSDSRFPRIEDRDLQLIIGENTASTSFDRHYIYHPAWAARILAKTRPELHVDIGSILAFPTLVSAWLDVEYYDYRPANVAISGMSSGSADLTDLPFENASIKSLSCMHVVEHIGLGRYGDPLDPTGDLKAMRELRRVLAPGGNLLFVVPVGRPRICFNAHRIYSYDQIIHAFSELKLQECYLIQDADDEPIFSPDRKLVNQQKYGCGCFWFRDER